MIVYNGKDLSDYGVCVLGRATYGAPARDVEAVHIPGRNGDLLFDNGGFLNADITYPECCILEDFPKNSEELRNFLLSSPGYHRLEDSYHPDEYRMAEFRGPFTADAHTPRNNASGTFDLAFNAQPQRWLKSGDRPLPCPLQTYENGKYVVKLRFPENMQLAGRDIFATTWQTNDYESYTMQADGGEIFTASGYDGIHHVFDTAVEEVVITCAGDYIGVISGYGLDIQYGSNAALQIVSKAPYNAPIWTVYPGTSNTVTIKIKDAGGTVKKTFSVSDVDGYNYPFTIDCMNGTAVYAWSSERSFSGNLYVSGDVPYLHDGINLIAIEGAIADTYVYCAPRWWRV